MKTNYLLRFKRRRTGQTNYKKRLNLLLSREKRAVIRVTNTAIIAQIIDYNEIGDIVITSANSKELKTIGFGANIKNIPSAYLTGLILAKKAKDKNIKKVVLDIGLHTPTKGSRVFAALKGLVDGGMDIPHSENNLPTEDRISGKHIDTYKKTNISKEFETTKDKILKMSFK
ncbi:MAG: 50S ribosomal protein L18 [DPANN group archaeon]|nr:50S ribosomal protein L18 [DPANN group archaeon]